MRISSAKSQTQSSAVNSIKDLILWLETTSENSLTSATNGNNPDDQDAISSWNDLNIQISSKNNATQGANGFRPKFVKNGINNLPSLEFDGSDDRLDINNVATESFSMFVVLKTDVAGVNGFAYAGRPVYWADDQTNGRDGIAMAIGGSTVKTFNGVTESNLSGATNVSDNSPHIIMTSRNMDNGARTIYVDGVLDNSDNDGATGSVLNDRTTAEIGGNLIDSLFFDGIIAEIIVFQRALKSEERVSVESYLAKKWGVDI